MESSDKKKLYALVAALAVLAAIWGYRLIPWSKAPEKASSTQGGMNIPAAPAPITVDLGMLEKEKPPLSVKRNIFNPVYRVPKVEPPPPPPVERKVTVQQPPAQPEWIPPEKRAQMSAQNEMKQLRFLGFVKRRERTDLFLTNGKEFFYAGLGETITKDFYVKEIGVDYILVGDRKSGAEYKMDVDFGGEANVAQTLPTAGAGGSASGTGGPTPPTRRPGMPTRRPNRPTPGRGGAFPPDSGVLPPDNVPDTSGGGYDNTPDTGETSGVTPGGNTYTPPPPPPNDQYSQ